MPGQEGRRHVRRTQSVLAVGDVVLDVGAHELVVLATPFDLQQRLDEPSLLGAGQRADVLTRVRHGSPGVVLAGGGRRVAQVLRRGPSSSTVPRAAARGGGTTGSGRSCSASCRRPGASGCSGRPSTVTCQVPAPTARPACGTGCRGCGGPGRSRRTRCSRPTRRRAVRDARGPVPCRWRARAPPVPGGGLGGPGGGDQGASVTARAGASSPLISCRRVPTAGPTLAGPSPW